MADATRTYEDGKYIFRMGDPGGSLIIIKEGEVSLLKNTDKGTEIEIGRLKAGDLIGSMTIQNGAPRSASAKTLGPVTVQVIDRHQIDKLMLSCPNWLKLILKDLTGRVHIADKKQIANLEEIENLNHRQVDNFKIACQIARCLKEFGDITAKDDAVSISDLLSRVEKVLVYKKSLITSIAEEFAKAGFLQSLRKDTQSLQHIHRLADFATFVNELNSSKKAEHEKKLALTPQERRKISVLLDLAKKLNCPDDKEQIFPFRQLESIMDQGQTWEPLVMEVAKECELIMTEEGPEGQGRVVRFTPRELAFNLRCIDLYHRLERGQEKTVRAA